MSFFCAMTPNKQPPGADANSLSLMPEMRAAVLMTQGHQLAGKQLRDVGPPKSPHPGGGRLTAKTGLLCCNRQISV